MSAPTSSPSPPTVAGIEVGSIAEISEEFGVPRTTVTSWASRRTLSGFPAPLAKLAMGPVYDMAEVRAWHDGYDPRPAKA
jgi:hypothetical protein